MEWTRIAVPLHLEGPVIATWRLRCKQREARLDTFRHRGCKEIGAGLPPPGEGPLDHLAPTLALRTRRAHIGHYPRNKPGCQRMPVRMVPWNRECSPIVGW